MKKQLVIMLFVVIPLFTQAQNALPELKVKSLEGKDVSIKDFLSEDKAIVISFWATWCKPCVNELTEIADVYDEWTEELDFVFLAISVDDTRSTAKVKSMVNGKEWPYTILLDQNQELKRALNVSTIPHTFIINKKGEIVFQHQGYTPGNEWEVYDELTKLK